MGDALGIEHLFELSGSEKVWAFFTPLIIFAAFFLAQLILPARKVTGYVKNPETGEPRNYRLNGLLIFVIAQILWATEATGLDRDWFYRSTLWAVLGGTVFTTIFALVAVYSQPKGEIQNPLVALWEGRAKEMQFFGERVDIVIFGYTHEAMVETFQDVLFVNPGSTSMIKQSMLLGHVAVLDITDDGASAEVIYLGDIEE